MVLSITGWLHIAVSYLKPGKPINSGGTPPELIGDQCPGSCTMGMGKPGILISYTLKYYDIVNGEITLVYDSLIVRIISK